MDVWTKDALVELSREELCTIIMKQQQPNLKRARDPEEEAEQPVKKKRKDETMEWTKFSLRHIALKIAYLGWDYHGLAAQHVEDEMPTIEGELFIALKKTKLVPEDATWKSINYSRSGRTDKGVSAFSQICGLDVRSHLSAGEGIIKVGTNPRPHEVDYVATLNRALPDQIRVLGWTPVPAEFNARFDCQTRTYHYVFVDKMNNINIEDMKQAGQLLLGERDFRNFCKFDPANEHWTRKILNVDISLISTEQLRGDKTLKTYSINIQGSGFLWHQIRCIAYILFLIGQGLEKVNLISELLDLSLHPAKPIYDIASDIPLILYDCSYEGLRFQCPKGSHERTLIGFQQLWEKERVKSVVLQDMICGMEGLEVDLKEPTSPNPKNDCVQIPLGEIRGRYIPFKDRQTEKVYEARPKRERTNSTTSKDD